MTSREELAAAQRRTITIDLATGEWLEAPEDGINVGEGFTVASSVLPGSSAEQVSGWFYESVNEDVLASPALARVIREAKAGAWGEGQDRGYICAQGYHAHGDGHGPDPWDCDCPNPYSEGEGR